MTQLEVAIHNALSAHVDGEDGAQPDKQDDERHEHGLHPHQVEYTNFVNRRFFVESLGGIALPAETLENPNACNVLLHEA